MKKLTKKEKEIFKKKTFKILNIVSYILSGIFIVFLIISLIQSCSPKNESSNDLTQTTETRQAQRLQDNSQDYFVNGARYSMYDTIDTVFFSGSHLVTILDTFTNYTYKYEDALLLQIDCVEVDSRDIYFNNLHTINEKRVVASMVFYSFVKITSSGINAIEYAVDTTLTYRGYVKTEVDNVILNKELLNYTFINEHIYWNSIDDVTFTFPPYFYLGDKSSFTYDIGFIFNGVKYNQIKYTYRKNLIFYNTLTGSVFDMFDLEVTENTGEIYFALNYQYFYNRNELNLTELPKLTFTSFGTIGESFLKENFIDNDNYFSGTYYLSLKKLQTYMFRVQNPSNDDTISLRDLEIRLNGIFYSNSKYFTDLDFTINYNNGVYTGGVLTLSNLNTNVVVYRFTWSTSEMQLVDVETNLDFYKIYYDLDTIDIDTWNLLYNLYALEGEQIIGIPTEGDNIALGNVFTLLGGAFGGIASLMSITIIPGITLGILLFIPLIILIILFIVHLFKR